MMAFQIHYMKYNNTFHIAVSNVTYCHADWSKRPKYKTWRGITEIKTFFQGDFFMYIMLTFIVFPKYLHLIYLQRICYLSLNCELSAFWKCDMRVRPKYFFLHLYTDEPPYFIRLYLRCYQNSEFTACIWKRKTKTKINCVYLMLYVGVKLVLSYNSVSKNKTRSPAKITTYGLWYIRELWKWRIGWKIRSSRRKPCPSAILSTTNPKWSGLGLNPGLRGEMPSINRLTWPALRGRCSSRIDTQWWTP
jgi:hypothetical protein